jgi:hypothetical protein
MAMPSVRTHPSDPLGRIGSITRAHPSWGPSRTVRTVVVPRRVVGAMARRGSVAPASANTGTTFLAPRTSEAPSGRDSTSSLSTAVVVVLGVGVVVGGVRVVLGVTTGMVEVAVGGGWYCPAPEQAAKKAQPRTDTVRRRIPTDGIGTCRSRLFTIMAYLVSLPADVEGAGERLHPG